LHPAAEYGCPIQAHIASIAQMIIVSNRGPEWLICARTQAHSYLHGLANIRHIVHINDPAETTVITTASAIQADV
jgi:hypothetical protein